MGCCRQLEMWSILINSKNLNCAGKTETDHWYKGSDAKLVSPSSFQIFGGLTICSKDELPLHSRPLSIRYRIEPTYTEKKSNPRIASTRKDTVQCGKRAHHHHHHHCRRSFRKQEDHGTDLLHLLHILLLYVLACRLVTMTAAIDAHCSIKGKTSKNFKKLSWSCGWIMLWQIHICNQRNVFNSVFYKI